LSKNDIDLRKLLENENFPLSNKYDPQWILANEMGPNALWLTEWLCRDMDLQPGMRVLDMGCGKCLSSVFLAREFGVQVWANDLWIKATDNWKRIREAGLEDQIFPIHAEAHSLPYAEGFFDAIVCVDSYIYYGTDDTYLAHFVKFVKPGGQIGIVVPGLMRDFNGPVPEHLKPFWGEDCWSWHTLDWWQHLWARTELVDIEVVETMPDGWRHWLQFKKARQAAGVRPPSSWDIEVMRTDQGKYVVLIRIIARRKEAQL
jgi:SAM-dependent methyltransferase